MSAVIQANPIPHVECNADGQIITELKRAVFASSSGDVVAAVSGKRIKVFAYAIQAGADGSTAQFTNGLAGDNLTVAWAFNNREGVCASPAKPPSYLFATSAGVSLYCVVTGTIKVEVSYWDDDAS